MSMTCYETRWVLNCSRALIAIKSTVAINSAVTVSASKGDVGIVNDMLAWFHSRVPVSIDSRQTSKVVLN